MLVLSCPSAALRALRCVCRVPAHLAHVHQCACSVGCFGCAVSWATWLLFTGVPAWFVVLRLRCPGSLGSCSPVRQLSVLCCVCGVPGFVTPVHLCARSVCCFACAASWATWLLFTCVPAWCVVLCVWCPGHLAFVHRCARVVCCVASEVSLATWLLFTGAPAPCVVLRVRVLAHLAPDYRCACSVCCVACVVSRANWLQFTAVPAPFVALLVRCPGPLGFCAPVCPLRLLFCLCGVPGQLAPVHRCARSVCCFVCAVSWATWLLFTSVPGPGVPSLCCPRCMLRTWHLFTGVCAVCAARVPLVVVFVFPPT